MPKLKDQSSDVVIKFTDSERDAFRALHSCGLHESIEFDSLCELNTIFFVNTDVVRVVMHPSELSVHSEDVIRAKALMVANTRVIEKSIGLCASAINVPMGGKDLLDSMVSAMSRITGTNVTHNFREYRPLTIKVSSKGLDYMQDYRVDVRSLVIDPLDVMASMSVKIKEDLNEYIRRTKE